MSKIPNFNSESVGYEKIESAMKSVLSEAGLLTDMVTKHQASKLLTSTIVSKGIQTGKLRITPKVTKNGKQLIPLKDVVAYKEELLRESQIKLK